MFLIKLNLFNFLLLSAAPHVLAAPAFEPREVLDTRQRKESQEVVDRYSLEVQSLNQRYGQAYKSYLNGKGKYPGDLSLRFWTLRSEREAALGQVQKRHDAEKKAYYEKLVREENRKPASHSPASSPWQALPTEKATIIDGSQFPKVIEFLDTGEKKLKH